MTLASWCNVIFWGGGGGPPGPSNPTPPLGDDIFTMLSDSLGPGRSNPEASRDPILDAPVDNTYQYVNRLGQAGYQSIVADTSPCWHPDDGVARVGVLESVLREYQSLTSAWGRSATVVPCGVGGTALLGSWNPATPGTDLVNAKNAHNSAYTQVRAVRPHSRIRGIIIDLSTNDGTGASYNSANARAAWIGLIDYVRLNFDGVDDETPFILGGPCVANGASGTVGVTWQDIRADIAYAATQRPLSYYVNPPVPSTNTNGDTIHPSMADNRIWGADIAEAIYTAPEPTVVEDFSIPSVMGAPLSTLTESEVFIPMLGYGESVTITVSGLEYQIDGGSWTSSAGTYQWGNELKVRLTSSGSNSTTVSGNITVGTKTTSFSVTTVAPAGTTNVVSTQRGTGYFDNGELRWSEGLIMETL